MSKGLVIGAAGFVGSYLLEEMHSCGMDCYATKLPHERLKHEHAKIYDLDILDRETIVTLLLEIRPDYIFHLAAQSSVGLSWKNPGLTVDVNIKGSINVMDAVRELYYKPRVLLIGSGEEYGHIRPGETPIREENLLRPGNIYAATKACQNMIGSIYAQAYDMQLMMVRSFNHIGPGQAPMFVVSDFCKQVAEIEKGLREPVMYVGNLAAKRDFTDVRDVVKAYVKLIQQGVSGETYNMGSGHAVEIRRILDMIISMSEKEIRVEIDPNKIRPVDVPIIEADITKLHELTGWKPQIELKQTIRDTLNYWRMHLQGGRHD
ncbi:MAG: NAD-dependent epimerase/dehydratase family protein [Lachnospiraceae bacterium]|nr:NAD-dependent epimerase/dehydratase family protein [Lachnospiraceae bacterium]